VGVDAPKFRLGQKVYHVVNGQAGVVVQIIYEVNGGIMYRVSTGFGEYVAAYRCELTEEPVYTASE
jgi:heat shock protein HspQ